MNAIFTVSPNSVCPALRVVPCPRPESPHKSPPWVLTGMIVVLVIGVVISCLSGQLFLTDFRETPQTSNFQRYYEDQEKKITDSIYHTVLDDFSLTFEQGKIYGVVGRNGSSKTVLFKCICGFLKPTAGTVIVGRILRCFVIPSFGWIMVKSFHYLHDSIYPIYLY